MRPNIWKVKVNSTWGPVSFVWPSLQQRRNEALLPTTPRPTPPLHHPDNNGTRFFLVFWLALLRFGVQSLLFPLLLCKAFCCGRYPAHPPTDLSYIKKLKACETKAIAATHRLHSQVASKRTALKLLLSISNLFVQVSL